jgi:hypothetical protein
MDMIYQVGITDISIEENNNNNNNRLEWKENDDYDYDVVKLKRWGWCGGIDKALKPRPQALAAETSADPYPAALCSETRQKSLVIPTTSPQTSTMRPFH